MGISKNFQNIKKELPNQISLVAVSKNQSYSKIMEVYESGHRIFGENKVQELVEKHEKLPKDSF